MLKVGITGGIGSGKTTACKVFETLGIPVYYADSQAKQLMVSDPRLVAGIKALFGPESYLRDGALNRPFIAQQVFSNDEKLKQLNALVHPAVAEDAERWHHAQENVPYTLKEAALLFESGSYKQLDKLITVSAPEKLRIQRVMERDGVSAEEVRARMKKQMPEEEKVKRSDFVIYNDGAHFLIRQVLDIHRALLAIIDTL
ncbi:MAG: dephospho-CoA kinase [Phaeodactylibacter sp.]|nr:dephospho-CoA kinase [Phaeodactylibacter sp.]